MIDRFPTGGLPQHVVPSWDMSVLYVNNNTGNSLTPIDPKTGKPGPNIAVDDPYNLYFTPDGKYAIVMEERNNIIAVRDAKTFAEVKKGQTPCRGVNHADYSIDGSYFIASCEFSSQIIKFDIATLEVVADLTIAGSVPQDVRVMNDGLTFLVADLNKGGVHVVDGERFEVIGFIATGAGAHGIYPSRNSKVMYVSNRAGFGERHRAIDSPSHLHLSHTGRWFTRHGQRLRRRSGAVALGSLPQRRLRHRRPRVEAARPHCGRRRARTGSRTFPNPVATRSATPATTADWPASRSEGALEGRSGPTRTSWSRGSPRPLWSCRSPGCGTIRASRR